MSTCLITRTTLVAAAALLTGCIVDSPTSSRFGQIQTCKSLDGGEDVDCIPITGGDTDTAADTSDGTTVGDSSSGTTAGEGSGTTSGSSGTTGEDTDTSSSTTFASATWGTTQDSTFGTWGTAPDTSDSAETNPDTISWTTVTDPSGGSDSNTTDSTSTSVSTSGETWTGGDATDSGATGSGASTGGDGGDGSDGTDGGTWTAGETGGDEGGDESGTTSSGSGTGSGSTGSGSGTGSGTGDDSGGDSSSGDDTGEPDCDPKQNEGKKPCPNYWVKAPEVLSTAHIAGFNPTTVAGFLIKQEPWKTAATELGGAYVTLFKFMIAGLAESANSDPPTSFSSGGMYGKKSGAWVVSKEYRGFMRIAPFKIHCDANTKKLAPKPCTDGKKLSDFYDGAESTIDHGWTKEPLNSFSRGELRTAAPGGTPAPGSIKAISAGDRGSNNKDSCVTYTAYFAARIANPLRTAQAVVSLFDAPFIWQDLRSTVCCDGTYDVHMTRSVFPTSSLYVNMDQVAVGGQYRLGDFIRSGGGPPPVHPPGEGFKAPAAAGPLTASGNARKIDACDGSITQQYTPAPSVSPP